MFASPSLNCVKNASQDINKKWEEHTNIIKLREKLHREKATHVAGSA